MLVLKFLEVMFDLVIKADSLHKLLLSYTFDVCFELFVCDLSDTLEHSIDKGKYSSREIFRTLMV